MKSFIALTPRIFFKYPFVTQREMTRGQMFLECLSLSLSLFFSSSSLSLILSFLNLLYQPIICSYAKSNAHTHITIVSNKHMIKYLQFLTVPSLSLSLSPKIRCTFSFFSCFLQMCVIQSHINTHTHTHFLLPAPSL